MECRGAGDPLDEILEGLSRYGRYESPPSVLTDLCEWYSAYGELVLERAGPDSLILIVRSPPIIERLRQDRELRRFWTGEVPDGFRVRVSERGEVKHALVKIGYPVKDLCGYTPGDPLDISLRSVDLDGRPFALRDYQTEAVEAFYHSGRATGGSGIIVLPCGSGKTIIGLGVLREVAASALVITTNDVAVHRWRDELLAKTTIAPHAVGEYTGQMKNVKPVTIATYQMPTYRRSTDEPMENLELFQASRARPGTKSGKSSMGTSRAGRLRALVVSKAGRSASGSQLRMPIMDQQSLAAAGREGRENSPLA